MKKRYYKIAAPIGKGCYDTVFTGNFPAVKYLSEVDPASLKIMHPYSVLETIGTEHECIKLVIHVDDVQLMHLTLAFGIKVYSSYGTLRYLWDNVRGKYEDFEIINVIRDTYNRKFLS